MQTGRLEGAQLEARFFLTLKPMLGAVTVWVCADALCVRLFFC